jgi:hypothetical protein
MHASQLNTVNDHLSTLSYNGKNQQSVKAFHRVQPVNQTSNVSQLPVGGKNLSLGGQSLSKISQPQQKPSNSPIINIKYDSLKLS